MTLEELKKEAESHGYRLIDNNLIDTFMVGCVNLRDRISNADLRHQYNQHLMKLINEADLANCVEHRVVDRVTHSDFIPMEEHTWVITVLRQKALR